MFVGSPPNTKTLYYVTKHRQLLLKKKPHYIKTFVEFKCIRILIKTTHLTNSEVLEPSSRSRNDKTVVKLTKSQRGEDLLRNQNNSGEFRSTNVLKKQVSVETDHPYSKSKSEMMY